MDITTANISNLQRNQMVAHYSGEVEAQFAKSSIIRSYVNVRRLVGTDTMFNRRVGRPSLQGINDTNVGLAPAPTKTGFGKASVTVDTIVLARDVRGMLNEFQTDFAAREALGQEHGKEIGKFFDEAHLIMNIKGSQKTEADSLNGAFGNGKNFTFTAANDHLDPTKLVDAIRTQITRFADEDIDRNELVIWVRPTEFQTLLDADKLVNMLYSATNGDYAAGRLATIEGCRIVESARIPRVATPAGEHHLLSNADNSNAYDITAKDASAAAVIMHPRSLLSAETIPLQSDVYFYQINKMWYIDSLISFGVAVNRADLCGCVFKHIA